MNADKAVELADEYRAKQNSLIGEYTQTILKKIIEEIAASAAMGAYSYSIRIGKLMQHISPIISNKVLNEVIEILEKQYNYSVSRPRTPMEEALERIGLGEDNFLTVKWK